MASAVVSSGAAPAPQGLHAPQAFFGAQGLHAFLVAQGLQGLQAFLAAQGLHAPQAFLAAQGLHGLQAFLAAQGLQGLQAFLAAQGLHGLQAFLVAHGLQAFFGLQALQDATWKLPSLSPVLEIAVGLLGKVLLAAKLISAKLTVLTVVIAATANNGITVEESSLPWSF